MPTLNRTSGGVVPGFHCGRFRLDLARPLLMGILNVTPDSFSDGGRHQALDAALAHAERLHEEGAAIIDVGGESTRPGAPPVPVEEELRRVVPVVEALAARGRLVSIDTRNPAVMRAALAAGAALVNDVNALRAPGALEVCADSDAGICLMHMQGDPLTMQQDPHYGDVCAEVSAFLAERAEAARAAGIGRERICLDPGFGFGKTVAHNLALLRGLPALAAHGYAVLAGLSRKSVLGAVTAKAPDDRVHASAAAALLAAQAGAHILRVHDVAATRNALAVWNALRETAG
ncbi:MAG: dihydropteroate synthase [Pseudomonadota bacterium]|nr:dihydropteroate synthase [Pseudomonadota bacterium]